MGGTPCSFKSRADVKELLQKHELKSDLVAAVTAQAKNQPDQGMVDLLQSFGTKCLEMSQQLKRE